MTAAAAVRARVAVAVVAILGATALVEHVNGRSVFCRCGRVRLWTGTVLGPENSQQLADWYSLSHVVHGLILCGATALVLRRAGGLSRLLLATAVEAAWEMAENAPAVIARYRAATVSLGYSGDSILNSLGDVGFMLLGFGVALRLPARWSVALAVTLELVSLLAIRDDLTLNVLMLLHPVPGIRAWQAG